MKVFAYYRTSSGAGVGDDKDSETRQRLAVQQFCARAGHTIEGEYYDQAVKGADQITDRPAFAEMLAAIAGNGVRAIVVETANRFARDLMTQETGYAMLKRQGIDLIAADSPSTFLEDTPTAVMVRQILGAVAQFEKAALVAKLTAARRRTGRMGGQAKLEAMRPEAAQRMKDLRAEFPSASLRALSAWLETEGHVTPSGKPYNPAQIARIVG